MSMQCSVLRRLKFSYNIYLPVSDKVLKYKDSLPTIIHTPKERERVLHRITGRGYWKGKDCSILTEISFSIEKTKSSALIKLGLFSYVFPHSASSQHLFQTGILQQPTYIYILTNYVVMNYVPKEWRPFSHLRKKSCIFLVELKSGWLV